MSSISQNPDLHPGQVRLGNIPNHASCTCISACCQLFYSYISPFPEGTRELVELPVLTGSSFPTVSFHPQSSGISCIPFHCCIWKYTLWLWYAAAADVGGRLSGCTKVVPVATFWQNLVYRSESRFSSGDLELYRQSGASSPAKTISSFVAAGRLKASACS